MANSEQEHAHIGYGGYTLIWLGLLALTALTVTAAGVNLGNVAVAVTILIATVKSYLVVTIFMHLKIESRLFRVAVYAAIFFIVVSIILLFSDYTFLRE